MTLKQESVNKDQVKDYLIDLQNNIVGTIELVDGKNFLHDSWQRKEGGGGTTCIMENGYIFERAGVGFSHVVGSKLPKSATDAHPEVANRNGRQWGSR
jgi:coproporphyrinogen III oxidase